MITQNIIQFGRLLRQCGIAVTPERTLRAVQSLDLIGVESRDDVHSALSATLLSAREQQNIFDQAFAFFWRDPKLADQLNLITLPSIPMRHKSRSRELPNRLAEALRTPSRNHSRPPEERRELDFSLTVSEKEKLQQADFETMTSREYELAKRLAAESPIPVPPVMQRRFESGAGNQIDLRRTIRLMMREPDVLVPVYRRRKEVVPKIVVLLDISGSMDRYSRLFLHYLHGLTRRHVRVNTFTFGTRLTQITDCLRHKDPDRAMQLIDARVRDWKGGTRMSSCIEEFLRRWARRALSGNTALIIVTDGLDSDASNERNKYFPALRRQAHCIVWLNPLLRFEDFQPQAAGIRDLLSIADWFLPMHNLDSLADLPRALKTPMQKISSQLPRSRTFRT